MDLMDWFFINPSAQVGRLCKPSSFNRTDYFKKQEQTCIVILSSMNKLDANLS